MKNTLMWIAGLGLTGVAGYVMMNKKVRKKAEALFDSMMDEADKTIKNITE